MRPIRDIRSDADLADVVRRCELRWRAAEQGLRECEIEALLAQGADEAERRLRASAGQPVCSPSQYPLVPAMSKMS